MSYGDLAGQLESIAEALTERSIETLRSAIEDGADAHPAEEKQLARAQRSIDKAIRILRSLDEAAGR